MTCARTRAASWLTTRATVRKTTKAAMLVGAAIVKVWSGGMKN